MKFNIPKLQPYVSGLDVHRHLARTNFSVDKLNTYEMKNNTDVFTLPLKKNGSNCKLTEMKLVNGSPVSPYKNGKLYYNNQDFNYMRREENNVILMSDKEITLSVKEFENTFIPAYAITVNRSLGSTFDFKYIIHEADSMCLNDLYVAMSRSRRFVDVFLSYPITHLTPFKYTTDAILLKIKHKHQTGYIYKISCDEDERIYIGSTFTPETRWIQHQRCVKMTIFTLR